MWRTQAIVSMLTEDVSGLPASDRETLEHARRRALAVAIFEWLAILVLILFHDQRTQQLTLSGSEQTLFSLGILVIAVHSGFRFANFLKLRTITRLCDELEARAGSGSEDAD